MQQVRKWLGIGGAALLALILIAVVGLYMTTNNRLNRTYAVDVKDFPVPSDAAAVERGKHILVTRGCHDCHGADLGGQVFLDAPPAYLYAPNLTSGEGGVGAAFSATDWSLAIRHGLSVDKKPLVFMPSTDYYLLSDADMGDLVAYLRSLPPVDRPSPASDVRPLGRILFASGQLPLLGAEFIDHANIPAAAPAPAVSAEYGEYLAAVCTGCHGMGFSGGVIPGVPPEWPPSANLTPAGNLANWSEEDFINTLRSGTTPEGKSLEPMYMPWPNIGKFTDDELKALWLFLQALPAKPSGGR